MSIKEKTIERIANQLVNLGCQIKIITEDGTEYGDLPVAVSLKRKQRIDVLSLVDYVTPTTNLKVGEAIEIPCPPDLHIERLRTSVIALSARLFGRGCVTTAIDKKHTRLEVLRVE